MNNEKIKTLNNDHFLFIISAPSGTGKTTICHYLLGKNDDLSLSISATTRQKRTAEVDGRDYYFISKEEFESRISCDEFLEYAHVFENYYGTPFNFVVNKLKSGFNVLFDIDWQGTRKIKQANKFNISTIFLLPPSLDVLRQRLIARGDDAKQVEKRINGFYNDVEKANEYDYIIVNDDLEKTCALIDNIYKTEKVKFMKNNMLNFVNNTLIKSCI